MSHSDWDWLEVLCQDFDRARSLTVLLMVQHGEWDQLVNLRCYPQDYCSPLFHTIDDFRFDYQITELLRKCSDLPVVTSDPKAKALDNFWDAEQLCANTNARLYNLRRQLSDDWFHPQGTSKWKPFIKIWRRIVRDILGPLPHDLGVKFSSGSTFDDKRYILPQDKMSSRATVTQQAYEVIEPFWRHTLWCQSLCAERPNRSLPKTVLGNRFTTVPKDATQHRGICVEPSLNVTHQLHVGGVIRERLSMQGIDLNFGQPVHQRLAEQASKTLEIATIDLSSASDTVSLELCRLILPSLWLDLLESLRSPFTRIKKNGERIWHKNAKFSSMGNGFTFELETLIFFSLAKAVEEFSGSKSSVVKVYGDDIIVDSWLAKLLVPALRFFGFKTNDRKTFIDDTPFRESCGSDYYRGVNVRGHYLESIPKEPIDWIKLANGIRRMASPDLHAFNDLYCYKRSWLRVISHMPTHIRRCRGPARLGDICIHDHRSTWAISTRRKDGIREIRVVLPSFSDDAYTSYDRKFWTRGSITSAATLGLLRDQGDTVVKCRDGKYLIIRGRQKLARVEPCGHKVKKILFFDHGHESLDLEAHLYQHQLHKVFHIQATRV